MDWASNGWGHRFHLHTQKASELLAAQGIAEFIYVDEATGPLEDFPDYVSSTEIGRLDYTEQRLTRFVLAE